jgi:hypothetical protein
MEITKTRITEKKRREGERIASWVMSIIFLGVTSFFITLWGIEGFSFGFKVEDFVLLGIASVISLSIGAVAWMLCFGEEHIRNKEYVIFEFEIWDEDSVKYVKGYDYSVNTISARYFMNFQIGNSENVVTVEDIEKRHSGDSAFDLRPYLSKEELMKDILDRIKSSINYKMEEQKIKIKNVTTSEVITVEELIKMVKGSE